MKLFGNKHGAEQNTASFQAVREPDRNTGPTKHRGGLIALGVIGILALLVTTKPMVGKGYLYPLIPFNSKALRRLLLREPISRDNT